MIAWIKTKLLAITAGAVAVLGVIVSVLARRNATLKQQRDKAKATADHAIEVIEKDTSINEQEDIRLKEAKDEISTDHHSSELSDPNDWEWVQDDK